MSLESNIEAVLFWKGEPTSLKKLSQAVESDEETVSAALLNLENSLKERGIVLMRKDDDVMLATSPSASAIIEKITKEELIKDLGKAGLETLSIILYKSPIKRSEIDYIRGVNSSFIIRNLLVRGLVERMSTKEGEGRGFLYQPTFKMLSHLGVSKIEDLPEYSEVKKELEVFESNIEEATQEESPAQQ